LPRFEVVLKDIIIKDTETLFSSHLTLLWLSTPQPLMGRRGACGMQEPSPGLVLLSQATGYTMVPGPAL
jgi:hypothetical protein